MEMKYKVADVQKLIDVFGSLSKKKNNDDSIANEIAILTKYPVEAIEVFLDAIDAISDNHAYDEAYLKDNYWGIMGYICIRMNVCRPKPRLTDF